MKSLQVYYSIPIRFVEVELEESLEIAAELKIYVYDAYLIRSALKYNAPLVSLDSGLVGAAQKKGVETIEVSR